MVKFKFESKDKLLNSNEFSNLEQTIQERIEFLWDKSQIIYFKSFLTEESFKFIEEAETLLSKQIESSLSKKNTDNLKKKLEKYTKLRTSLMNLWNKKQIITIPAEYKVLPITVDMSMHIDHYNPFVNFIYHS